MIVTLKASFHSRKFSVVGTDKKIFRCVKVIIVPTQSSQDKEKFSCPFQYTDNFPEWKLAFT